ncbi:Putative Wax synthase domain-containing protein [Colletotrichum destructivum]|uniref:Wax synthase domain-containing protein n=1 Tax=Colletotrichum destructivum TaxID=34406 RepID=A0AAX4IKW2_9PEZI|nr:Putative Wax synthase domain-containing protein [Colletotrichum destructivum]
MDPTGAADYPNMTGDEQWDWSDYDMEAYADLYPQHNYAEMSYARALYTFFVWETWMSVRQIFTRELVHPVLLYALSVGCIAAALNVRERYRAAWVAASVAIGAVIVEYVARTDFVYVVKDSLVRLVVIHNLGAVVMILWERFCLTDEQKKLPWGRRAIATYKIMWNSRFVNTARPAPVFHLLKAEEERQREVLCTAAAEEDKVVNRDGNTAYPGNPDDTDDTDDNDGYLKNAWKTTRQVTHGAWGRVHQPFSRLWGALTPKQRWITRTVAKITAVWALDRVLDQLADVYIDFDWWDIQLHKTSFLRRLREVSSREVMIRCYFAFQAVWGAYAFYTIVHSAIAVFFVGLGVDEPDEWPPVFGDVRQAWNLRRFWSKYWDRLIYRAVNGLGEMLLTAVGLGGPRPFRGRKRWLLNGLVFAISGVFHGFTDYFSGIRCSYVWEFWWWAANFVAVVGETALLHAVRTYFPRFHNRMRGRPGKAVGFLWVFAWLFWAYPKSQFTTMHCLPENR